MARRKTQTIPNVRVVSIGHKGLCIGKTPEGEAVLVKGAVPGDVIDYQVRKRRNKMKWGVPQGYIHYSKDRQEPVCEHFEHCGGCSWQNLSYDAQLVQKQDLVHQAVRRIGGISEARFLPILGAEETLYYRNKMVYSFSWKRWLTPLEIRGGEIYDEPGLGFYAGGTFDKVIDIQACHLQEEPTNRLRNHVRSWAKEEGFRFYNANTHEGDLRNLLLRCSQKGDWMVTLVTGNDNREIIESFTASLTRHFPEVKTVAWMINTKWNDGLQDVDFHTVYGPGYITETLGDVRFRIGPKSFFQTNSRQAVTLFDAVKNAAGLSDQDCLYDLYCGVGTIGLYLAGNVKKVVGIEEIPEAIEDARVNAQINDLTNTAFEVGDVRVLLDEVFLQRHGPPSIIITDPPRAGMHEDVVKTLNAHPVERMVYVSCNPSTQARDLSMLNESYTVESVQPVDMFPQTNHVESIALLKRRI